MSGSTRFFTATALILIGSKPDAPRGVDACQHARQIVAARDLLEPLAVERIEVDVQAAQPGVVQRLAPACASSTRVGGQREVANARNRGQLARSARGRSRRTSGSPPVMRSLVTPSDAATRTKRSISSKSRISSRGHELHALFRHAVEAADVAAVRDADPQIVVHAAESDR